MECVRTSVTLWMGLWALGTGVSFGAHGQAPSAACASYVPVDAWMDSQGCRLELDQEGPVLGVSLGTEVHRYRMSPDSRYIVLMLHSGGNEIYEVPSWKPVGRFGSCMDVRFSTDSKTAYCGNLGYHHASASQDYSRVEVASLDLKKRKKNLKKTRYPGFCDAFNFRVLPSGEVFCDTSGGRKIRILDVADGANAWLVVPKYGTVVESIRHVKIQKKGADPQTVNMAGTPEFAAVQVIGLSRDGDRIYFRNGSSVDGLMSGKIQTGLEKLPGTRGLVGVSEARDGSGRVIYNDAENLWVIRDPSEAVSGVFPISGRLGFELLPDGKTAVIVGRLGVTSYRISRRCLSDLWDEEKYTERDRSSPEKTARWDRLVLSECMNSQLRASKFPPTTPRRWRVMQETLRTLKIEKKPVTLAALDVGDGPELPPNYVERVIENLKPGTGKSTELQKVKERIGSVVNQRGWIPAEIFTARRVVSLIRYQGLQPTAENIALSLQAQGKCLRRERDFVVPVALDADQAMQIGWQITDYERHCNSSQDCSKSESAARNLRQLANETRGLERSWIDAWARDVERSRSRTCSAQQSSRIQVAPVISKGAR